MNKIILDTGVFLKNGVSTDEVLLMINILNKSDPEKARESLQDKGLILKKPGSLFDEYVLTSAGTTLMKKIIYSSDSDVPSDKALESLAGDLRAMFPKGLQQGKYSWRESVPIIVDRLKGFYKKIGDMYSHEQIRQATEHYVKRMSDDPFMKTLKYFIWNTQKGTFESPLAAEIELLEEGVEDTGDDWKTNII